MAEKKTKKSTGAKARRKGVPPEDQPLTVKQKRWCDAFMGEAKGNGTEASRIAGYKGSYNVLASVASENLKKPNILKYLRESQAGDPLVADAKERQEWWSAVMRGLHPCEMKDRLKASELLGKTQGDFVEKIELSGAAQVHLYMPDNGRKAGQHE